MSNDNVIDSTVIMSGEISIGRGNTILPYSVLTGPLKIGDGNVIGPHVVIGSPGQNTRDPWYDHSNKRIEIGDRNIIREFTAIQKPCFGEVTSLGSRNFLMQSVHIPHDIVIEDDVVVTPMTVFAGSVRVLRGANLGLGVTVHQGTVIGQFSMIAMGFALIKNVRPFTKVIPGKPPTVNEYAVTKFGFEKHRDEIETYVFRGARPSSSEIGSIVSHYQTLHVASGRHEY